MNRTNQMADELSLVYDRPLHCTVANVRTKHVLEADIAAEPGGAGECFNPIDLVAAAVGT